MLAGVDKVRIPRKASDNDEAKTTTQYSVNLGFTGWELDLFGRLRSLKASALQQYLATEEARPAAQAALVAAVASEYLLLAADNEALRLAQATLDAQQTSLDLLQKSRDAGIGSDLDVRQSQTQVETARVAVAAFRGQMATDRNVLDLLAGTAVPPDLLPQDLSSVGETRALSPGLPSEVLLTRPDILAAEHRLMASNADIGAARAAFFPRISLTAAVGTVSRELSGLFSSGTGSWSFAPQIAAPIWAIGASRPTEPPEPIVTAAVRVRSPTVRGRMIPPCNAIVSIALGTPSPLASVGNRWRSGPIRRPPSSGRRNTRYGGLPIAWKIPPKKSFSKNRMSRMNATEPRPARAPMNVASRIWNASSPMWNRSRVR